MIPRAFASSRALLGLLPALLLSSPADANCEAGGYQMHTVAEYGSGDPDTNFLLYRHDAEKGQLRLQRTASGGGDLFDSAAPRSVTLLRGDTRCTLEAADEGGVAQKTEEEGQELVVPLNGCADFAKGIPASGYLQVRLSQNHWLLPTELPLKSDASARPAPAHAAEIRQVALRQLGRWLHGEPMGSRAIAEADILNLDQPDITHTTAGEGFTLWAMRYRITHLAELRSGLNIPTPVPPVVGFPVVFLQRGEAAPVFIGDGSWCALAVGYPVPRPGADIPEVERFTLTKAFDLDGDGLPEVFELNSAFAYHLAEDGKLWVFHYGEGC